MDGLELPAVPPQPKLRAELEHTIEQEGIDALFAHLLRLDPEAAARIDLGAIPGG